MRGDAASRGSVVTAGSDPLAPLRPRPCCVSPPRRLPRRLPRPRGMSGGAVTEGAMEEGRSAILLPTCSAAALTGACTDDPTAGVSTIPVPRTGRTCGAAPRPRRAGRPTSCRASSVLRRSPCGIAASRGPPSSAPLVSPSPTLAAAVAARPRPPPRRRPPPRSRGVGGGNEVGTNAGALGSSRIGAGVVSIERTLLQHLRSTTERRSSFAIASLYV